MVGFFERSPKNRSMMRLLSFLGFILGAVVALFGVGLLAYAVIQIADGNVQMTNVIGSLVLVISGGLALAGGGEAMKVVQQRGEVKEALNEVGLESNNDTTATSAGGNGL